MSAGVRLSGQAWRCTCNLLCCTAHVTPKPCDTGQCLHLLQQCGIFVRLGCRELSCWVSSSSWATQEIINVHGLWRRDGSGLNRHAAIVLQPRVMQCCHLRGTMQCLSCLLPAQHMQQYGMYVKPYCWASSMAWLPCCTAAREVQGSKQHERLAAAGPLRRLQAHAWCHGAETALASDGHAAISVSGLCSASQDVAKRRYAATASQQAVC